MKPLCGHAYVRQSRNSRALTQRKERNLPIPAIARPSARRAADSVSRQRPAAEEILHRVLASLDDMKAEDTVAIDLSVKTTIADSMVVTSGRSQRHVGSIADRVLKDLARAGVPDARVEGMRQCDWVLIDAGDVIVHVFRPDVRAFYNLEKMWASAPPQGRRAS